MNSYRQYVGARQPPTPLGFEKRERLQTLNPKKDTASRSDDYVRLNASGLTLIPGILVYRSGWARNSLRMCLSPFFWPRFSPTWPAYHHIRLSTHQLIPTAQSQHFRRNACRRRRGIRDSDSLTRTDERSEYGRSQY